jgi:uncharacterized protein
MPVRIEMQNWEKVFEQKISEIATSDDPAHDILHFRRVVKVAKRICKDENGNPDVVIPAAWLHDFVIVPKNDPRRSMASRLSADAAIDYLESIQYPSKYYNEIAHAIAAHSFSANISCETLEAKIVQDADRLDGVGAIGIARVFAVAGMLKRPLYNPNDPFCEQRPPNDQIFTVDHFYKKLFKTIDTLQTNSGKRIGQNRALLMKRYLDDLSSEIN